MSKEFLESMKNQLVENEEYNEAYSENGALMYNTSGSTLVDLMYLISSCRSDDDAKLDFELLFEKLYNENRVYAIIFLFFLRDVRGGLGERDLFRRCFKVLVYNRDKSIPSLIREVNDYGRFDDLLLLIDTKYEDELASYLKSVLSSDKYSMKMMKPISLLAKWLPSENASSSSTIRLARKVARLLGYSSMKEYRKELSSLRSYLKITEKFICSNQLSEINYSEVPSGAMSKYYQIFLNKDNERYSEYIEDLKSGKSKVNSRVLFPYQVVRIDNDELRDAMWRELLSKDDSSIEDTIVVRDGSYSMTSEVTGRTTAMDIGDSITLYAASKLKGEFHNKFITFSSRPDLVELPDKDSLSSILRYLRNKYFDSSTTNIQRVFELLLDSSLKSPSGYMPKRVLIISDMEFNPYESAYESKEFGIDRNLFKSIKESYERKGKKLPKLIFWNVANRSGAVPVVKNDNGLVYIGGFSDNAFKMVKSDELDPQSAILEILESDRYNRIKSIVNNTSK